MAEKQNPIHPIIAELKDALRLNVDYAKLTVAEKLVTLFSAFTIGLICFVLISLLMFFVSLAIVRFIATGTGLVSAYLIMGAFYLVILIIVLVFRKQMLINPIARFVTRLLLKP